VAVPPQQAIPQAAIGSTRHPSNAQTAFATLVGTRAARMARRRRVFLRWSVGLKVVACLVL